ncbi:MAG: O-acetyl-ADP-ribose deacetylase [Candidatus Pseudobacter hemicellulosilyticus]|uniref:O-acetyl-ADP-ribose deacetylase n=1 Tax=Candidatus Pseudobacter hemicellulosilyticus TaxID=3121375 RepID=A0AAJ5WUW2_9BACT|nr:MAG: O-acetyl-ADP-ribose deacetylase [Pseudobacter sp.]
MTIELIKGDITTQQVDAIVNAANSSLLGGGGVDGAIHRKGGKAILEDCMAIRAKQGSCPTGEAVITTAGNLPARYVIHTVGPVWNGGRSREEELLKNCYLNSMELARQHAISSIAFPNISTGIYHFPKEKAAAIAISAIRSLPAAHPVQRLLFICFDDENYLIYKGLLDQPYS